MTDAAKGDEAEEWGRGGDKAISPFSALWWLRLGIRIERIEPGHPQQNGRHERMHRTLKADATKPAAPNVLQHQARFDTFVARYNQERPHQALDMQVPADRYARSARL
jgi:transposase InsO family protein